MWQTMTWENGISNPPRLIDIRACDGSRHFMSLPQSETWHAVRDYVTALDGATLTGFLSDHITEAWVDFTYHGYAFTINNQHGEYWFFSNDPNCPDAILQLVSNHFAKLLLQL
jgi:hypothetical protein